MSFRISKVHELLYRLGVTSNYTGFFQTAYAVYLAAQEPRRLLLITKTLYPEVARYYGTSWKSVERNIRTAADIAWRCNRGFLEELARCSLESRPTASGFIAILASRFPKNCG